jgi:biopolymer transport protein ExbB/TolQ
MNQPKTEREAVRRSGTTLAAFLLGLPLAAGILGAFHFGPLHDTDAFRYVCHWAQGATVVFFCCALGTLIGKLLQTIVERRAGRTAVVPAWDRKPVPVGDAPALFAALSRLPRRVQTTYLVQRVRAVLDFLCQRRSAADLDDHLRTLADNDAMALESSYSLTRFITWAMPILGFLGTVLGITTAIAGVNPETLEHSLGSVTDGLSEAFNSTALALGLTMLTMFFTFLVERAEQAALDAVDRYVDRELAHRFQRASAESSPFLEAVQQNTQVLLDASDRLVRRQAEVWAQSLGQTERRTAEAQDQMVGAIETALERTLQSHAGRLAALEKQAVEQSARLYEQLAALAGAVRDTGREQQVALVRVADGLTAQTAVLTRLQEGEKQLVQLQTVLQQNLTALAGAGAFEQAVHSLTAAIHLLTARAAAQPENTLLPWPRNAA